MRWGVPARKRASVEIDARTATGDEGWSTYDSPFWGRGDRKSTPIRGFTSDERAFTTRPTHSGLSRWNRAECLLGDSAVPTMHESLIRESLT